MNCSAIDCLKEAEYFCSCRKEPLIYLCKEHIYSHIGDFHKPDNLYYCPNDNERSGLVSIINQKLSELESKKATKIEEAFLELEKINNTLKNALDPIEKDISRLQDLTRIIVSTTKFSRFSRTCCLFNSTYEATLKFLEDDKIITSENCSTEIIPNFSYTENQLCQDLNNIRFWPFSALNPPKEIIPDKTNTINAAWSKLDGNGELILYSKADNEIIENAYQNGQDRVYIGDIYSPCYANLKSPKIEVHENAKKAVTVIRSSESRESDSNRNLNSSLAKHWYFKGDKRWEKMTPEASRIAEWAYQNKLQEVLIQNCNSYKLDIKGMKQINLQTKYKRDVKRGNDSENNSRSWIYTDRAFPGYPRSGSQTPKINLESDLSIRSDGSSFMSKK